MLLGVAACAGCGGERQDENEPEGDFAVEVVDAMFPEKQKLAKTSELVITVRNAGDETVPNVAVTVNGLNYRSEASGRRQRRAPAVRHQRRPARDRGTAGGQGRRARRAATPPTWTPGPAAR